MKAMLMNRLGKCQMKNSKGQIWYLLGVEGHNKKKTYVATEMYLESYLEMTGMEKEEIIEYLEENCECCVSLF